MKPRNISNNEPPALTLEQAFKFGKYNGLMVRDVATNIPDYVIYLSRSGINMDLDVLELAISNMTPEREEKLWESLY